VSDWHLLTPEDLDAFAAVTREERLVDLDVERAKQTLGGTMARGYYTRLLGRTSGRGARRRRS
jgi:acyl dehydratase